MNKTPHSSLVIAESASKKGLAFREKTMTYLHCSRGNNDPRMDGPCEKRKESTLVNSEGSPQPTTQYMSRRGWVSSNHCICRTTIDVGKNWRKRIRKETKPTTSLKRFLSSSTTSQVTHTYREHQSKKKIQI